ncbi:MAG: hypothetical protein GY906_24505 [bacterium]|nr:hypothetical protein [bacterium]
MKTPIDPDLGSPAPYSQWAMLSFLCLGASISKPLNRFNPLPGCISIHLHEALVAWGEDPACLLCQGIYKEGEYCRACGRTL